MYICASVDDITGQCLVWSEYFGLLPPLATSDALKISAAAMSVWAICWGTKLIARTIINR